MIGLSIGLKLGSGGGSGTAPPFVPDGAVVYGDGNPVVYGLGNYIVMIPPAPVNTVLPVLTGTSQEGQVAFASDGTWTNSPASFTYQWKLNGADVPGATAFFYVFTAGDIGKVPTCVVTAANEGGSTPATSGAMSAVIAASSGGGYTPLTPTIYVDSPLTNPPTFHADLDFPIAGDILRLTIASDTGFTSIVQTHNVTLTDAMIADGEAPFGVTTLSAGTYYAHIDHGRAGNYSAVSAYVTFPE